MNAKLLLLTLIVLASAPLRGLAQTPTVTSVSPSVIFKDPSGTTETTLTITGSGFLGPTSFSALPVPLGLRFENPNVTSETTIVVTARVSRFALVGIRDFELSNSNGQSVIVQDLITVSEPGAPPALDLSSVSPNELTRKTDGDNVVTVRLTGTAFEDGMAVSVEPGSQGLEVNNVTFLNETSADVEFLVRSDATLGSHDLELTTASDTLLAEDAVLVLSEAIATTDVTFVEMTDYVSFSSFPLQTWGSALWADLNNDGWLDAIYPSHTTFPRFLYSNGDGSFSVTRPRDIGVEPVSGIDTGDWHGYSLIDFENDGDLDLFISEGARQGVATKSDILLLNDGSGNFIDVRTTVSPTGLNPLGRGRFGVWFDYDDDGFLDLFLKNYQSDNHVYMNNGTGGLVDVSSTPELSSFVSMQEGSIVALADFDQNGKTDLYISGMGSDFEDALLMQEPNGSFIDATTSAGIATASGSRGIAVADYDNDGDIDIYVARGYDDTNSQTPTPSDLSDKLFRNEGDGTFTEVSGAAGLSNGQLNTWAAAWGDVNNDGWLDLFVTHPGTADLGIFPDKSDDSVTDTFLLLYLNNGDGTFSEGAAQAGVSNLSDDIEHRNFAVSLGDYDLDGFLDVMLKNGLGRHGGKSQLFRNQGNANNRILCVLQGTASNRSGIGAEVSVETTSTTQTQQLYQGNGGTLYSQSVMPLHFGLGTDTQANLKVTWPSQTHHELSNVASGQILTIVEPTLGFEVDGSSLVVDSGQNRLLLTVTGSSLSAVSSAEVEAHPAIVAGQASVQFISETEILVEIPTQPGESIDLPLDVFLNENTGNSYRLRSAITVP